MPEARHQMVIHHADRLHVRVHDGRANEAEAAISAAAIYGEHKSLGIIVWHEPEPME